jgi:hypothetical protein
MAQERYYNYGGTASNVAENLLHGTLNTKGVYLGMDLSANSDNNVQIATGAALQPDGVMWRETDPVNLVFSAPGTATEYTVYATHDDRNILGGVAVTYTLDDTGLFTDTDLTNGVVLGWIYHPGGGLPLIDDYIQSAPKQVSSVAVPEAVATAPLELLPPIPRSAITNVGVNVTVTEKDFDGSEFLVFQKVENSPTGVPPVQQAVQNISLYYEGYRPQEIEVYTEFPSSPSTQMAIEVYDTAQAPVAVTGGTLTGDVGWVTTTATVARTGGTFDEGKPYTIRLTYDVNQGTYIRLGRVVVRTSPYPS